MPGDEEERKDAANELPKEGAAALEGLRKLWGATGRERDFIQHGAGEGSGKATMEEIIGKVGFGGLEDFAQGEATTDTHAAGQRLSSAWKKTMEREGKLMHPGQSVSDLLAAKGAGGRVTDGVKGGNQERPPWEKDDES